MSLPRMHPNILAVSFLSAIALFLWEIVYLDSLFITLA